jgi:hypothetical protein
MVLAVCEIATRMQTYSQTYSQIAADQQHATKVTVVTFGVGNPQMPLASPFPREGTNRFLANGPPTTFHYRVCQISMSESTLRFTDIIRISAN